MGALNPVRELQPGDSPRDWMESMESSAWAEPTESTPPANDDSTTEESDSAAAAPQPAPARLEPQRYRVQFEASEEYAKLVERAKALLSPSAPRADLGELHLRAMRCLVTELERRKYAVTARPRSLSAARSEPDASAQLESQKGPILRKNASPRVRPRPNARASAVDTCPPRSGVPSSRVTQGAARTRATPVSAAERPRGSSSITRKRSRAAASIG